MKRLQFYIAALLILISNFAQSQCAMCKAVVESGDYEMSESLNTGIIYLMVFPYLIVGIAGYLLYRNWKKSKL